ncbi:hypothetical protein RirG_254640 [Rhizophagus irregularis DAOM 197198w]|uniref:Uncharacterized protein n=1 Tax=Rhizophagus irregularis (strain DAOM 197198w) TaxID=1432141 RepID=A0A015JYM9_RHIIW|nr:hypothetical protein RirG_254640 [Rhizophagus irregularis DAOM 197198w]
MKEFELDIDTNSEKRAQKSKENVQSRSEEVNLESDRKEKTEGGRKTSNNGVRQRPRTVRSDCDFRLTTPPKPTVPLHVKLL